MEKKIKEVYDYFKGKVVSGEYEIKDCDMHTMTLIVDGKYKFVMWLANGEWALETYENSASFMQLEFTDEEKAVAYKKLLAHKKRLFNEQAISERKKEIEKLEEELLMINT